MWRKISLFLTLYRKKYAENIVICGLFSLLGTVVSMVLFVQQNNGILLKHQLEISGFADAGGTAKLVDGLSMAYQNTENILGLIAIAAIITGAAGGLCLIGFRNRETEKAVVMMHIYGMQRKDLYVKAIMDSMIFGVASSVLGYAGGYLLFIRFSGKILKTGQFVKLFSPLSMIVFGKTLLLCAGIVFLGNLYMDTNIVETPVTEFLYKRKGQGKGKIHLYILLLEIVGIAGYSLLVFHVNRKYFAVSGAVTLLLAIVLFFLFHLFFGVFTKKKRKTMKIEKLGDLGFCFLCSRNKRDAALSIIISVGTIILCLIANVLFNISGMLRNAYRDNMGYTSVVFVDDFSSKEKVGNVLDEHGFTYTFGYSKLMDYSKLQGMDFREGQFWAFIIGRNKDHNMHFSVPEGTFISEKYFEGQCGLVLGGYTEIFGKQILYKGEITDNQYLSLISYNFIVNEADWKLGIDDSFYPVYFLDVSIADEKRLKDVLAELDCHVDSASELIDELKTGMEEYLDILAFVGGMIFLVTVAVFYMVIRSDLAKRRTETYLYRIFGASFEKAQRVIFYEYLMIAFVSSFAVSFTVMFCGELYFYYGLGKHFPLSIPVMAATTGFAVLFVLLCCWLAGKRNERVTGLEVIRDE